MTGRVFSVFFCISILLLLTVGIVGCAIHGRVRIEDDTGSVTVEVNKGPGQGHYEGTLPNIPLGHKPPPGKCRIWFPGKPPGQQPPPGDCWELERQVPPGAWLIRV